MQTMYRRGTAPRIAGPAYKPEASRGAAGAPSGIAPKAEQGLDMKSLGGLIGLLKQDGFGALPGSGDGFAAVDDALAAAAQTMANISALPRF